MKSTIRFNTKLSGQNIYLPKNVNLETVGKIGIEGIVSGLAFRTFLESDSKGYFIKINKTLFGLLNKSGQESFDVEITKAGEERVPADLNRALNTNSKVKALWEDITPLARRDWIFWVITGKKIETRNIRIEKAISKMSGGMRRVCCFAGVAWVE